MLVTRPRSQSGELVCTAVFVRAIVVLMANPVAAIRTIASTAVSPMPATTPSAISKVPNSSAEPSMSRRDGRRLVKASVSAPISEPTPSDDMSSPNPLAPIWSASRARRGAQTPKFMPKMAIRPARMIGMRTAGELRTYARPSRSRSLGEPSSPPRLGQPMVRIMPRPTMTGKYETARSEEHTSELQSHSDLVCRLLLEKKKKKICTLLLLKKKKKQKKHK